MVFTGERNAVYEGKTSCFTGKGIIGMRDGNECSGFLRETNVNNHYNLIHALGSAAFLRSVGAQALRGGLAKNKNNKMIIRNHTTKISGSLTGLPDFFAIN